ncbi:MAG: ECF-type sigma factor [Bryobacteraceae bacterium]
MANPGGEVTLLPTETRLGDKDALARRRPLVCEELQRLAGYYLRDECIGRTVQPTAMVHEAFVPSASQDRADWEHRRQLMGVTPQRMRPILVDYARQQAAATRAAVTLNEEQLGPTPGVDRTKEILAVEEVLERLAALDSYWAGVVPLRYFVGLSVAETAEMIEIPPRTVKAARAMATAWRHAQLAGWKAV